MQQPHTQASQYTLTQPSADKSAQKSATRYEVDHDLIAEEENDGSSFLVAEQEAQKVIEEEVTDDGRSQVSQNLMGAHLISNQELYPFRGGSAFQTPKPIRDDIQGA